jgi:IS5 family transposase
MRSFVIWSHGTGFIMSHQLTFADSEFSRRRQTRKEILSRMEQILPWQNMGSHRAVLGSVPAEGEMTP